MKIFIGIIIGIILVLTIKSADAHSNQEEGSGWVFEQENKWVITYYQAQASPDTYEKLSKQVSKIADKCKIIQISGGHDLEVIVTDEPYCLKKVKGLN